MTNDGPWTLDQLVELVGTVLSSSYPGAPSGRVRDLPDRRAIRWYTTTGLVDRPQMKGRVGYYYRRHLLQVVAIKRCQSAGKSLAEIQAALSGATDDTLAAIAKVPEGDVAPVRDRFWATPAGKMTQTVVSDERKPRLNSDLSFGIPLAPGVTLLVTTHPTPDDLAAIQVAAESLLAELDRRGLAPIPPSKELT